MTATKRKGVGARFLDELQRRLAPLLESNGFKKSGRSYYRVYNDRRYDVIEMRVTIYGSFEHSRFTIEVYQHDAHKDSRHTQHWKTFPTNESNVFCRNIGDFIPDGHEQWWNVRETTDAASISNEVAKLLEGVVIPYFGSWGPGKRPLFTAAW